MFANDNNNLFNSLTDGTEPGSELEELNIRVATLDRQETLRTMLSDQLNGGGIRVDIVNQIDSGNSDISTKTELMEEVLNQIILRYDFDIDVFKAKSNYEDLLNTTRLVYYFSYYESSDILALLFKELLLRNPAKLNTLYRAYKSNVSPSSISFIKNNTGDKEENYHKLFTLIDPILDNVEQFTGVFGEEDLYENLSDGGNDLIEFIKRQNPSSIIAVYNDRVFTNSFVTSMFRNRVKSSMVVSMKRES